MERIQEKIESLVRYRQTLDDTDKEVFDVLMNYAREVASSIEQDRSRMNVQGC